MSNQRLVPLNVAALASAPAGTPKIGDLYYNTTNLKTWVYSSGGWVVAAGGGAAFQTSAPTGPQVGDIWVDSDAAINLLTPDDYALLSGPTFTGPSTVAVNSASTALTIKQTGAGNALVVEDSASPDSTPFVIDASGNVGIGTTTTFGAKLKVGDGTDPAYILQAGTAQYVGTSIRNTQDTTSAATVSFVDFQRENAVADAHVFAVHNIDGSASLTFGVTPAGSKSSDRRTTSMVISGSGNVGIGTSSPGSRLVVNGGAGTSQTRFEVNTTQVQEVATNAAQNAYADRLSDAAQHVWKVSSTERMRIDAAGNVGIARTAPSGLVVSLVNNYTLMPDDGAYIGLGAAYYNAAWRNAVADTGGSAIRNSGGVFTVFAADSPGGGVAGAALSMSERLRISGAGLITGTGTSLGAWTAYTPTLGGTGWAIGDGTATGAYVRIGKIVIARFIVTLGSTSTAGASPLNISLPVTGTGHIAPAGSIRAVDASTGTQYGNTFQPDTTVISPVAANGTNGAYSSYYTTTGPFTWAVSDVIYGTVIYEAA